MFGQMPWHLEFENIKILSLSSKEYKEDLIDQIANFLKSRTFKLWQWKYKDLLFN